MSRSSALLSMSVHESLILLSNMRSSLTAHVESTVDLLGSLSAEMSYVTGPERSDVVNSWLVVDRYPCLLLVNNNEVIGILSTHWNGRHSKDLWIELIAVSPTHRSQGLGSRLLAELIDHVQRFTVYKSISLSVSSKNHNAIALYERFGFSESPGLSLPYRKMKLTMR